MEVRVIIHLRLQHNGDPGADLRPETGSLKFLLLGSQMGGRWDFKMRVRGPEMFSPPQPDVANGCESKLLLHGHTKQTHRDRWSSSRMTDGRIGWCNSAKRPVREQFQENSKEAKLRGRRKPICL